MRTRSLHRSLHVALIALALGTAPAVLARSDRATPGLPGLEHRTLPASANLALTPDEAADLLFVREEEKLARDTYQTLYELWALSTLSTIAFSEQRHMDSMLRLLVKYALPDPAASNPVGVFTNPALQALYDALLVRGKASPAEALQVGGLIEETDMRDITSALETASKSDIDRVYGNLLCGSRNHLRAFATSLAALTGQAYVAQVLSQAEVDAIVETPVERCGGK